MRSFLTTTAIALCVCGAANAQSRGDWMYGLGVAAVSPNSNPTHTRAGQIEVDTSVRPTMTAEYFINSRVGVELMAAWPFKHTIRVAGQKIGDAKQLPPTLSMNYYFKNPSKATPFLGAGVNYTMFYDENAHGPLNGHKIKLKDSFGYAFHAGIDFELAQNSAIRADIRYLDIDTKVKIDGNKVGKVRVDPFVFGASYLLRF